MYCKNDDARAAGRLPDRNFADQSKNEAGEPCRLIRDGRVSGHAQLTMG